MEALWKKLWSFWSADDSIVDPDTGLTGREKKLVTSTWAVINKDPVASGVAIMLGLFERHPEYQSMFPAFRDVPREELGTNKRFQAHSANVITALNSVIDALNDGGLLEATLLTLGERHGRRGQTREQFLNLRPVIMDVFRKALGSKFTEETEQAWIKTLDATYAILFKGITT